MKKHKILLNWISYFTLFFAGALLCLYAFFQLYPFKIQERVSPYLKVLNESTTVRPGEVLVMEDNYCKSLPYSTTVKRSFLDGVIYELPEYESNRGTGCVEGKETVQIPETLQPGNYQYRMQFIYHLPFNRVIMESVVSTPFTVVN